MQNWYNGTNWAQRIFMVVVALAITVAVDALFYNKTLTLAAFLPLLLLIFLQLGAFRKKKTAP